MYTCWHNRRCAPNLLSSINGSLWCIMSPRWCILSYTCYHPSSRRCTGVTTMDKVDLSRLLFVRTLLRRTVRSPSSHSQRSNRAGMSITVCFHTAALAKDLWTLMGSCTESERKKGERSLEKKKMKKDKRVISSLCSLCSAPSLHKHLQW